MSTPILVGYDPRTSDDAPIRFGIAAARLTGARLIVASVQAGAPALPVPVTTLPAAIGQVDEDLLRLVWHSHPDNPIVDSLLDLATAWTRDGRHTRTRP